MTERSSKMLMPWMSNIKRPGPKCCKLQGNAEPSHTYRKGPSIVWLGLTEIRMCFRKSNCTSFDSIADSSTWDSTASSVAVPANPALKLLLHHSLTSTALVKQRLSLLHNSVANPSIFLGPLYLFQLTGNFDHCG